MDDSELNKHRQLVMRSVFQGGVDFDGVPSNAKSFIAWMQDLLTKVPEQYRDNVDIRFDYGEDHGAAYCDIEIRYCEPQTDDEATQTIYRLKAMKAARLADLRSELKKLEAQDDQ